MRALEPFRTTLLLLVLVLLASLAWVGVRGALAARHLQSLERSLTALQAAVNDPRSSQLDALTSAAQKQARSARHDTDDLVWKVWSHAPVLGRPMTVIAGVSAEADRLTATPMPALVSAAKLIRTLRASDGAINTQPLSAQAPALRAAAASVSTSAQRVQDLPVTRFGLVNRARDRLETKLNALTRQAQALAAGATAAPDLLGFKGSRRYLIAVQNNAEARASGGIVGAYGILQVAQGRPHLETFGSDTDLREADANSIDFGAEWRARYDVLGQARDWREVTATPDFPTAARAMLALWAVTHGGEKLDGVVSVDPVALAEVLQATGPIASGSSTLTAATFVQATVSDAYRLFPDKVQRSAVLSSSARAVFTALTQGVGSPLVLGERLGQAIVTGHFKVFSTNADSERELATTDIAGVLPTQAPLLGVFTQDGNNDKLSYYLRRDISYAQVPGPAYLTLGGAQGVQRTEQGHLLVKLTNTAPTSGLPDYVAPATNLATGLPIPPGRMRVSLSVYVGAFGTLDAVAIDGKQTSAESQTEKGLSVFTLALDLDPGRSRTVELVFRQPAPLGEPLQLLKQPLLSPDAFLVSRTR